MYLFIREPVVHFVYNNKPLFISLYVVSGRHDGAVVALAPHSKNVLGSKPRG